MRPGGSPLGRLAELEEASSRPRVLLVVDQFEELFAAEVTEDDRKSFLDRLARLPAAVMAVLRADFYSHCLRYPKLRRALQDNQLTSGRILDALAGARLAVIGREEAELAHDAMLYAWPQLQEWIRRPAPRC